MTTFVGMLDLETGVTTLSPWSIADIDAQLPPERPFIAVKETVDIDGTNWLVTSFGTAGRTFAVIVDKTTGVVQSTVLVDELPPGGGGVLFDVALDRAALQFYVCGDKADGGADLSLVKLSGEVVYSVETDPSIDLETIWLGVPPVPVLNLGNHRNRVVAR